MSLKTDEPLVLRAGILALVAPALALAASFGLDLTAEQQAGIATFLAAAVPVVLALWARRRVTPSAKVPPAR